jgi:NodT family efflux transporter outer membrane factor (OMF) lipoprotein
MQNNDLTDGSLHGALAGCGVLPPCALFIALLSGCASVGPSYQPPTPQLPDAWSQVGGYDTEGTEDLSHWWLNLRDPLLSELIQEALRQAPDLEDARARVREARARRVLAGSQRFPTVTAAGSARHSQGSEASGGGATRELYQAAIDAAWEPDLFGGVRRGEQAAQADLEANLAGLYANQVSLVAEVALNYIELRALQGRLQIAQANLASQTETLRITEWRAQAGLTTVLDVDQARTTLEQTRAQVPTLETGLAQARHRLGILLGEAPGHLASRLAEPGPLPPIPDRILVGIPADTLRRRPDVRAAERTLAAETARIGVAQAARYPGFSLSGSLGLEALTLGGLGGGDAVTGSLLAGVTGTLFDAGRKAQQVEIQNAVQAQALANYRSTLLTALEEVENALVALDRGRRRTRTLETAAGGPPTPSGWRASNTPRAWWTSRPCSPPSAPCCRSRTA